MNVIFWKTKPRPLPYSEQDSLPQLLEKLGAAQPYDAAVISARIRLLAEKSAVETPPKSARPKGSPRMEVYDEPAEILRDVEAPDTGVQVSMPAETRSTAKPLSRSELEGLHALRLSPREAGVKRPVEPMDFKLMDLYTQFAAPQTATAPEATPASVATGVGLLRDSLEHLSQNIERMRNQLRELESQAAQIKATSAEAHRGD